MREREPFADEMDELGPAAAWPPIDDEAEPRATAAHAPVIRAAPFVMVAPESIPPRRWLLGRHLLRKFISTTVSPGGIGKSSLVIAETLAMVTGRDLIGHPPRGRFRVWYVNLEDPQEELQRRFVAAASLYGINPEDIAGRLFVNSGRDTPMVVARQDRAGITIAVPVVEAIKATIRENLIDVLVLDPFVSCHEVSENDNGAINTVATIWASIADETDTAIDLIHHSRKTGGGEVQMEDLRGAVALLSKARAGRVLNVMTKEEAEAAGVDERRVHFRVDAGKANLAPPPSEGSSWFKLVSVPLHNGPLGSEGDSVGVVTAWKWPDPFEDITLKDLHAAQVAVSQGGPWRANVQAKEWVGRPIALALRLNPDEKAHREKVKRILGTWIAAGMFVVVPGKNDRGRDTPMVEVGKPATAED